MTEIQKKAKFDFIRYANCWEDADVLLDALEIKKGDSCLSIASAGDNSLSLLTRNPGMVVAVDLNDTQLFCSELRIIGFKKLNYDELLRFLGIRKEKDRLEIYHSLRGELSEPAAAYWDNKLESIRDGIIHSGKFESYFHTFKRYILPLIHRERTVLELLEKKSIEEQRKFYDSKWNNINWRILFRIFFGKFTMGKLGRDPEFFNYVEEDVASSMIRRTEFAMTAIPTYTNPYLTFILTGNYQEHALPHYLREENFSVIKNNIEKIHFFKGDIASVLEHYNQVKFSAFNLSDIFEYMNINEYHSLLRLLAAHSAHGGRIAFWNMLADRTIPEDFPIAWDQKKSSELHLQDNAFFYKRFVLGRCN